jgi:hypothetical protein
MLVFTALLKKTTAVVWCLVLMLFAGSLGSSTANAVTQLNGFNLENDEQGTVRIRLNTPEPIQIEEQRQQGVYKLILKNTTISSKMKQEGLPVVMDAQGKYIARATQLSNNQVTITIPNGVDLNHQVQVIGGAAATAPVRSAETELSSQSQQAVPMNPFFAEASDAKPAVKGLKIKSKTRQAVLHPHQKLKPPSKVPQLTIRVAEKGLVGWDNEARGTELGRLHTVNNRNEYQSNKISTLNKPFSVTSVVKVLPAVVMTKKLEPVEPVALKQSASKAFVEKSTDTPIELSASQPVAQEPIVFEAVADLEGMVAQANTIMVANTTKAELLETEAKPLPTTALVYDNAWLKQRFLPENTPLLPVEGDAFPLLPMATIAVGSALALGLGLWAKQTGMTQKLLKTLGLNQKETPLGVSAEPVEISPASSAVSVATHNIVDSLFSASLKQQVLATPPLPLPSLVVHVLEDQQPQMLDILTETPRPAHVTVAEPTPPMVPQAVVAMVSPTLVALPSPFRGVASVPTAPLVTSGSALQATLVQAIKQSESPAVVVAMPQRSRLAPTFVAASATKGDFKSVTQRFSNKKFQGVY